MKTGTKPTSFGLYGVNVIDAGGRIVGIRLLGTPATAAACLVRWRVTPDTVTDGLLVHDARRYRELRKFLPDPHDPDAFLRLNVTVGGIFAPYDDVVDLIEDPHRAAAQRTPYVPYRSGPVPGTGKRTPYRYFRRKIASYPSRREAACVAEETAPPVRPSRNCVNLPDPRDDISRCRQRSWKKTRRHQWRPLA